ncbi:hypothetical protein F9H64_25525 [Vibrio parahaemolyticus]|nr:hypothetical protein BGM07_015930 [Vibrio parahaemolyticus]EQM04264.1 hypothetical protein D019_2299 [Vibrio parahaemolyticus VP2007-095]AWA89738.1 hypothetical protein BSG32_12070 [Vibrio parahaemolyticus]EGQ9176347.1 hypothetical protein [Vibrio parahaemolyticus]EGQ9349080.1 hypothetical protein [Vibrio parahaemolyticus]
MKFGGSALLPLNAALVANKKNVPKAECLGLMSVCFRLDIRISISSFWVCDNRALVPCTV